MQVLQDDVRMTLTESRREPGVLVLEVSTGHGCVEVDTAPEDGPEPIPLG